MPCLLSSMGLLSLRLPTQPSISGLICIGKPKHNWRQLKKAISGQLVKNSITPPLT